jgi:type I restriction enzyme S subunit
MNHANWKERTFGDLVDFHDHKRVPLSGTAREHRKGPYPYYGASGIIDYIDDYIFDGRYLLIAEDGENLRSRTTPIAFFASGKFWVNNHAHIVTARRSEAVDYFLKAWIDGADIGGYITGAAQPKLSQENLKRIKLRVPRVQVQRKIAAILSAYDDLIENNTRRIKILEQMARAIYHEWFLEFRAPGVELRKTTPEEQKLTGKDVFPKGWEIKKLSSLVQTQYGYTESASELPIGPKYLRGMDINKTSYIQWHSVPYCRIVEDEFLRYKLSPGDVLVIRMADPGKIGIVEKDVDAVFASYLIRLTIHHSGLTPYYLFYFLLSDRYQGYITGASTGTTRKSASASVITDVELVVPAANILKSFEELVATKRKMLTTLLDKNATLRRTRDLLLPKLISGEVALEELDIEAKGGL